MPIEYAAGNVRLKPIAPDAVGLFEVDRGRQKTALKSVAGATLSHDTHYALDLPLHQSRPNLDDHALRRNDVIRIYDIVFDYTTLLDTDAFYRELIKGEAFARPMGTAASVSTLPKPS